MDLNCRQISSGSAGNISGMRNGLRINNLAALASLCHFCNKISNHLSIGKTLRALANKQKVFKSGRERRGPLSLTGSPLECPALPAKSSVPALFALAAQRMLCGKALKLCRKWVPTLSAYRVKRFSHLMSFRITLGNTTWLKFHFPMSLALASRFLPFFSAAILFLLPLHFVRERERADRKRDFPSRFCFLPCCLACLGLPVFLRLLLIIVALFP